MANQTSSRANIHDVAIVGGGLAGLSAACALVASGYHVHLVERRPYVGGRASSYEHPGTGEVVDNCQHVLLGCCTNLIDFYNQLGVVDQIRWFNRITFMEPGGRQSLLRPGILPAPLHNATAFLQSSALSLADKAAISRGMMSFLQGVPADDGENFASWLKRHGQTRRAIDRFWNPVLVSALNEDLDRVSVHYAAMVFRTSFMQSEQAGWIGVPTIPLSELYSHAVGFIEARGGQVSLRRSVNSFQYDEAVRRWRMGFDGGHVEADAVVLAVPFESMQKLVPLL
ncbi:MAG TPA: hydroxysqualene dehydroxylase HpnE, partial [Acidobacteriaceae bacterium]|nr:hydroxysqualene dehydroxylase HpnE [Acidobacteriaceae bacterium]